MPTLPFYKYQGTGNDFVVIDNRQQILSKNNTNLVRRLCDRRFGIGGDGLLLLENASGAEEDFKMVYFNADGNLGSMCGNGGRCIVKFAKDLGLIDSTTSFSASDGLHKAVMEGNEVALQMKDVVEVQEFKEHYFLNTGSPHHILFSSDIDQVDVNKEGRKIRYSEAYKSIGGTNVNFVQILENDSIRVRTYERGVEDETLSCGTGVTAAAIAFQRRQPEVHSEIKVRTKGGELKVKFTERNNKFINIWLSGPAEKVFKGSICYEL